MGRPAIDLIGNKYGRLTVLSRDYSSKSGAGKPVKWLCGCDCGGTTITMKANLDRGTQSCGCLVSERMRDMNITHGLYGTKWYQAYWSNVKRGRKKRAIPKWANMEKIKEIYKGRPIGYHVDHIVPLTSKIVCGLHCEDNLQYLLAKENMSKKNKLLEKYLGN